MATRHHAVIIALMAGIAHGQTYIWTNDAGQVQWSANRADAYLAVGAVATSSVAPVMNADVWDVSPDTTIPIIDPATSNVVGTARLIATPDLSLVAVTNSASPQRPKSEQLAAFRAAAARQAKAKADQSAATNAFGKGQLQDRIAAVEAWISAQESK